MLVKLRAESNGQTDNMSFDDMVVPASMAGAALEGIAKLFDTLRRARNVTQGPIPNSGVLS